MFQHNYLSRYITQDTQAIYRGLDPQTAVMRAASGMTRTIDPRRPRDLSDAQLANVRRHPEVKLLLRVRRSFAKRIRSKHGTISKMRGTQIYDEYQQACRQHQNKKKAVRKQLMMQVKLNYRKQQPLVDIQIQLNGHVQKPDASVTDTTLSPERHRVFAALFTFAASDPAEECQRRSNAINAITTVCQRQELIPRKACRTQQTYSMASNDGNFTTKDGVRAETKEVPDKVPMECLPTQCIFCLGQLKMSLEARQKVFRNHDGLKRHFYRKHLRHYPDDEPIDCPHPECNVRLRHKEHLQNHAAMIHKTFT